MLNTPEDFNRALLALPAADEEARSAARARQATLTKPPGSLGRLEELAIWFAGWHGDARPRLDNALALIFAGNHGVTAQGISPYPPEVTAQMVANFEAGGAAINQLCTIAGAELRVTALDLEKPTGDIATGRALSDEDCLDALNTGMASVEEDAGVVLLGEMGIGNTTIASALAMACFGGEAELWCGAGTGLDADGISHKARIVTQAVAHNAAATNNAFSMLAHLGGREQAALAGAALAARQRRIPVILDGFISCAAVGVLGWAQKGALDHCVAGHRSRESGHSRLLEALALEPIVDLDMRLGEGSGAAVALTILRAALATHNGMASFAEAGVSDRD